MEQTNFQYFIAIDSVWLKILEMEKKIFLLMLNIFSLMESEMLPIDCNAEQPVINILAAEPLNLMHQGTIVKYEKVPIAKLLNSFNVGLQKKYITAKLNAGDLMIHTTTDFVYYARDQNATSILLELKFACAAVERGNRTLIFKQPILLRNYYAPVFTKSFYEIVMPTPIFSGYELTNLLEITARDNDLTQNRITFRALNLPKLVLSVSAKTKPDALGKIYYVILRLNRMFLRLERPIEFVLYAIDSGIPKRNASTNVIIRQDSNSHLPQIPRFKQDFFFTLLKPDLTLPTFKIQLMQGRYANTLSYQLNGSTDAILFNVNSSNSSASINTLELRLAKTLNMKMLRNRTYLYFIVSAVNKDLNDDIFMAKTVVLVQVPQLKAHFYFEKSVYVGYLSNDYRTLTMTHNITLNRLGFSSHVTFAISGIMSQFFELIQKEHNLTLQLIRNRTAEKWSNEDFITMDIIAESDSTELKAMASVFIKMPRNHNSTMTNEQPEFEKPIYRGIIHNRTGVLTIEPITLINKSLQSAKTEITLMDDYNNNFDCILMDNKVVLKMLERPKAAMGNGSMILLTLEAKIGKLKGRTTIALEMITNTNLAECSRSIFLRTWVVGKILGTNSAVQELYIDPIQLIKDTNTASYKFALLGEKAEHFGLSVCQDTLEVKLELNKYLVGDTSNRTEIVLEMRAEHNESHGFKSIIAIFIQLQRRDCLHQISSLLPVAPKFSSDNYIFTVSPSDKGSIGFVIATRPGNNASISYILQVNDVELRKRILINANSGELLLLSYINPGIYYFTITALEKISLTQTSAQVRLDVLMFLKCNETGQPEVSSAIIVKNVEEGLAYPELLNIRLDDNCAFVIQDMIPNDKDYVYINKTTQMLSTLPMDYESNIFHEMAVPQVRVLLRLQCLSKVITKSIRRKNRTMSFSDSFSEDMPYTKDTTQLKIFIIDVNDNAPQFIYPQNSTILGYPAGNALTEILPPNLVQVRAIDADKISKGEIEYSLLPNEYFDIYDKSGIIYPKPAVFHNGNYTELQVEAKDRDGLTSLLALAVYSLPIEFYMLLRLDDNGRSDKLSEIFKEISKITECELIKVKQSLLPSIPKDESHQSGFFTRNQQSGLQLYVWFYAIKNKEPIASVPFQDLLAAIGIYANDSSIMLKSLTEIMTERIQPNDTINYIATISILTAISVTCIIFLLYCFECWNFKRHKRIHKVCKLKHYAKDEHRDTTMSTFSQAVEQRFAVIHF